MNHTRILLRVCLEHAILQGTLAVARLHATRHEKGQGPSTYWTQDSSHKTNTDFANTYAILRLCQF